MTGPKRAAIYIRVSTDQQAREGESIPAQRARLHEWARAQGYVVAAEYCDAGESARAADRPEFIRMLKDARGTPRPFDAILVWKWDRFARNVDDATIYKGLLRRQLGLDLVAVGDPQTVGAVGVLLERILDVVAEFQSLITAEHVKNTMTYLARDGRWLGKVPFGYRLDGQGKLTARDDEASAVAWAFEQVRRREATVSSIADEFARGARFPSTIARGYKWSPQAVRQMLRNPVYTGRAIWNRRSVAVLSINGMSQKRRGKRDASDWVVVEEAHPAIVDQDAFDAVQRVLDEVGSRYARTAYGEYLFRGLVRCARCGHRCVYFAPRNGSHPRLVCSQYFRIPSAACRPMTYIRAAELTAIVLGTMRQLLEGEDPPGLEVAVTRKPESTNSETLLQSTRQRLARLMDAYEAGAVTLEEFRSRRAILDAEVSRLQEAAAQRQEEEGDRERLLDALRKRLQQALPILADDEEASVAQKNAALAEVIDRIVVDGDGGGVRVFWRVDAAADGASADDVGGSSLRRFATERRETRCSCSAPWRSGCSGCRSSA